ncbi:MAG: cell division protein ZapA [Leucothrix sp.]
MSDKPITVSAKILSKEYVIACPPEEQEALELSVRHVDKQMQDIRNGGKVIGAERIAVMAAINIAHEMLKSQSQVQSIDVDVITRLDELQLRINQSLENANNP